MNEMIDYKKTEDELATLRKEIEEMDENIAVIKAVGGHDIAPLEKARRRIELGIEAREQYLEERDDVVNILRDCRDLIIMVKTKTVMTYHETVLDELSERVTKSISKLKYYK